MASLGSPARALLSSAGRASAERRVSRVQAGSSLSFSYITNLWFGLSFNRRRQLSSEGSSFQCT